MYLCNIAVIPFPLQVQFIGSTLCRTTSENLNLRKFIKQLSIFHTDIQSRPVVSYGAEAWTLTTKEEQALLIFESKIFRRIYGPKYENEEWKSRTNRELE